MRRIVLLSIIINIISLPLLSQSVYWEDNMKGYKSWEREGNWKIYDGDLRFVWNPEIHDFDCSATSEIISLDDHANKLLVNQYLQVFVPSVIQEMAEISLTENGNTHVLFEHNLFTGNWGDENGKDTALDISEFAGKDVRIKFRTYGVTTFAWDYWKVYNVKILSNYDNDIAVLNLDGPHSIEQGQYATFNIEVANRGVSQQSGYILQLYNLKNGDLLAELQAGDVMDPGQSMIYNIDWTAGEAQNTALSAVVISASDDFPGNNIYKSHFLRIHDGDDFHVLIWDNDNNIETLIDPEKGDLVQTDKGMERAFDEAGISYTNLPVLPPDLSPYDMIFVNLGLYCLS